MTSTERAGPQTRRERQRQATYDEIVAVARELVRRGDKPTLRGVAGEMGMTPPALYRYVDSHQHLLQLICRSIFDDVVATLTDARERHPDDDPGAQIVVAAVAFRRWALTHPEEFGLIFASFDTSDAAQADDAAEHGGTGGDTFGVFFADIYVRIWARYEFAIPADDDLDPAVRAALGKGKVAQLDGNGHTMPLGLNWVFMRAWSRLYGTVTIEVFRHMDPALVDTGALFTAMMEDNGAELNFGADWPRLRALVIKEMAR